MLRDMGAAQAKRQASPLGIPLHGYRERNHRHRILDRQTHSGAPTFGADFPRAASKEGIRKEINHDGMRQSLRRLKSELESGHAS
jgi:hypothetical protein